MVESLGKGTARREKGAEEEWNPDGGRRVLVRGGRNVKEDKKRPKDVKSRYENTA